MATQSQMIKKKAYEDTLELLATLNAPDVAALNSIKHSPFSFAYNEETRIFDIIFTGGRIITNRIEFDADWDIIRNRMREAMIQTFEADGMDMESVLTFLG